MNLADWRWFDYLRKSSINCYMLRARLIRALDGSFIMRIMCEVTIKDIVDLHEKAGARSKVYRSWLRQGRLTSAILNALMWGIPPFILLFAGWSLPIVIIIAVLAAFAGAGISVFMYPDVVRRRMVNFYLEQYGGRSTIPFEVELSEEGIRTQQLGDQNMFEWSNVEEMEVTEEAIHIYAHGGRVVGLKKSKFASMAEEQQFIDTARQYLNESRNSSNWLHAT